MATLLVSSQQDGAPHLDANCMQPHQLTAAYGVVRVLAESQPHSRLYLCEQIASTELVVVKSALHDTTQPFKNHMGGAAENERWLVGDNEVVDMQHQTQAIDSLDQEIWVAQLVQARPHPNIVVVVDVQANRSGSGGAPAIVMAYYPSGDLFSLLEQQPTHSFTEADALRFFRQIVAGVAHLHSLGIAHRDISLENVLIGADGNAAVCDFGLSTDTATPSFDCVGKLQYMAPEVASVAGSTTGYDPVLADVWSLGIVLFILLTGSPLFAKPVPSDPAWQAVEGVGVAGILKHWGVADHISRQTMVLLTLLLETNPSRRPPSMEEVLRRTEAAVRGRL